MNKSTVKSRVGFAVAVNRGIKKEIKHAPEKGGKKLYTAWNVTGQELPDGTIQVLLAWNEDRPDPGQLPRTIFENMYYPPSWLPPTIACNK